MISSQRIEALPNAIYQALNDASVVQQCIPGCETIEKLSDYEMKAIIKLKTGPMKVSSRLTRLGNSLSRSCHASGERPLPYSPRRSLRTPP